MIRANLAIVLQELNDLSAAHVLFEQALASNVKTYGAKHPEVATTQANFARLLEKLGELRAACALYAAAFESDLRTYEAKHPKVTKRRANVARLLYLLGQLPNARLVQHVGHLVQHVGYKVRWDEGTTMMQDHSTWCPSHLEDLPPDELLIEKGLALTSVLTVVR